MALSTIPTLLVSLRAERNSFSANFYRKVFVAPTEADKTQSKRQVLLLYYFLEAK
jgi:hypothetical protein